MASKVIWAVLRCQEFDLYKTLYDEFFHDENEDYFHNYDEEITSNLKEAIKEGFQFVKLQNVFKTSIL